MQRDSLSFCTAKTTMKSFFILNILAGQRSRSRQILIYLIYPLHHDWDIRQLYAATELCLMSLGLCFVLCPMKDQPSSAPLLLSSSVIFGLLVCSSQWASSQSNFGLS